MPENQQKTIYSQRDIKNAFKKYNTVNKTTSIRLELACTTYKAMRYLGRRWEEEEAAALCPPLQPETPFWRPGWKQWSPHASAASCLASLEALPGRRPKSGRLSIPFDRHSAIFDQFNRILEIVLWELKRKPLECLCDWRFLVEAINKSLFNSNHSSVSVQKDAFPVFAQLRSKSGMKPMTSDRIGSLHFPLYLHPEHRRSDSGATVIVHSPLPPLGNGL